jgi:hypothetical protein
MRAVDDRPTLADLQLEYAMYRRSPKFRAKVRRANLIWRSLGWTATAGPLIAHALHYGIWPTPVLTACLLGVAYTLIVKAAGYLAKGAGSRKAGKREPQHLFGYGKLGHEHWWNLIPVSPGVNWMENALLFGGHRSKRHKWRTFWRTIIAALLVRSWWVLGASAAAMWYWSPLAVGTWLERLAVRL